MPSTYGIQRFGGLRLDIDPEEVGYSGAVDLLDVAPPFDGVLRTRWGSTKLNTSTLSSTGYQSIFPAFNGFVLAGRRSGSTILLDKIDASNGTTTNLGSFAATSTASTVMSWAAVGSATATTVYFTVADLTSASTVRKTDGSTVSTGTGKPVFVCALPTNNRLAQACYFNAADTPSGSNGTQSTVFFSDPGAPDTYTSSNYVELDPGGRGADHGNGGLARAAVRVQVD